MSKKELILRDWLAIDRTKLANERTFLAYFRTSIVFLASGQSILKLEFFAEVRELGYLMLLLFPIILLIGIARFYIVRRAICKYYQ